MVATGFLAYSHPMWKVQKAMQIQDVLPYTINNQIKFTGLSNGYSFFKNRDGVNSLWNGFLFGAVFNIIDFCDEEFQKHIFKLDKYIPKEEDAPNSDRIWRYFKGNLMYQLIVGASLYPIYNMWIRMIGDIEPVAKYANIWDCAAKVWKHEGFRGFYTGFSWGLLKLVTRSVFKTINYIKQTKGNDGTARRPLLYPLQLFEESCVYAIDTIGARAILGLPLLAAGASGIGILPDIFSGFTVQLWSLGPEFLCLWAYTVFSKKLEN